MMKILRFTCFFCTLGLIMSQSQDRTSSVPSNTHGRGTDDVTDLTITENSANVSATWTSAPDDGNMTKNDEMVGTPLMKHLFDIGFHDVLGDECEQKLKDYGHYPKLNLFHVYCLCLLSCYKPFTNHDLSEEDLLRKVALNEESRVNSNKIKFETILPLTAGVTGSFAFIALVGIIGNILVLVTVSKFMRKPSVTYIFICSISCSDLLVCSVCAPMKMYKRLNSVDSNIHVCRAMNFLYWMSLGCSAFSLLAMSMERYIVICHAMKAQTLSTTGRAKKIVLAVWFAAGALAIPFCYFTVSGSSCAISLDRVSRAGVIAFIFVPATAFYIIPVVLMTFAYVSVSVTLWKSIKTSKSLQNKGDQANGADGGKKASENSEASGRVAVIRMLIILLVIFFLCWSLFWWFNMLRVTSVLPMIIPYNVTVIEAVSNILTYLNSAINPILYAFSSRPMRDGFVDCFLVCCGKPPRYAKDKVTRSVTASTAISASVSSVSVSKTPVSA